MDSQTFYDAWFERLDAIDQELVIKLHPRPGDTHIYTLLRPLSAQAANRARLERTDTGWITQHRPTPPPNYYQLRYHEQHDRYTRKLRKVEAENQRWTTWKDQYLADLSPSPFFPASILPAPLDDRHYWQGKTVHFHVSRKHSNITYYPLQLADATTTAWLETSGHTIITYAPPTIVHNWYDTQWHSEPNQPRTALDALASSLTNYPIAWGNYHRWLHNSLGQDTLISIARSKPPKADPSTALASKWFRIPVIATHGELGYGDPVERSHALHRQYTHDNSGYLWRLHSWIPLDSPDSAAWPTQDDIDLYFKYGTLCPSQAVPPRDQESATIANTPTAESQHR